jgi:hypothetical protein
VWDVIGICSRHGSGGGGVSGTVTFSNLGCRTDSFPTMLQVLHASRMVRVEGRLLAAVSWVSSLPTLGSRRSRRSLRVRGEMGARLRMETTADGNTRKTTRGAWVKIDERRETKRRTHPSAHPAHDEREGRGVETAMSQQ